MKEIESEYHPTLQKMELRLKKLKQHDMVSGVWFRTKTEPQPGGPAVNTATKVAPYQRLPTFISKHIWQVPLSRVIQYLIG